MRRSKHDYDQRASAGLPQASLPGFDSPLASTDPEFVERLDRFAFGEVPASDDLDDRTRMMAILASLVGAQAIDLFKAMAKGAFNVPHAG
ncbi:MAG: carboxymuconolactone decarboxylase family protein [Eggerthella lenta]